MSVAAVDTAHAPMRADVSDAAFVRGWLWLVLGLVVIMVTIGGATRLTGSGLSITEWRPITGALPPFSEAAWLSEFEKYRQISQYELLNKGMSLAEFKFIYWWEWGHRQLGRFIGLLYLGGFFWVTFRRKVSGGTALVLFGMGLLLGLQGLVGWIMVASGLEPGMTAVAPIKLTLHLTFACLFFASLIIMLARLGAFGPPVEASSGLRRGMWALVGLVFVQIALGGLVAGSKAGMTYNTWPLMDGAFIPPASALFVVQPFWENFVDNVLLVQFNHRIGAYVLAAVAFALAVAAWRQGRSWRVMGGLIATSVLAQIVLGIVTLLLVVPLWAGLAHQALGLGVLAVALVAACRATTSVQSPARA